MRIGKKKFFFSKNEITITMALDGKLYRRGIFKWN